MNCGPRALQRPRRDSRAVWDAANGSTSGASPEGNDGVTGAAAVTDPRVVPDGWFVPPGDEVKVAATRNYFAAIFAGCRTAEQYGRELQRQLDSLAAENERLRQALEGDPRCPIEGEYDDCRQGQCPACRGKESRRATSARQEPTRTAIEVKEAVAKHRQGKPISFPKRRQPPQ